MNQKNIFMIIGVVLLLQGILFYAMGDKMALSTFPDLNDSGKFAVVNLLQVISMMSILVGLISFAARNSPQAIWAFTIGFALFGLNSLKHMFINHINVPIVAIVIQLGIALVCAYLWMQQGKKTATS
jgi:hypothetical protein